MEIYTFSQWVLFFYIYCFLGWVFACAYVSICEKHWVNRGFLKGPLLFIYGCGALCILIVTIPFRDNIPLMCLAGMASATVLEYVTGAAMEKLFHVRYWDYTGRLLNLNGHICLASVLCWGVMTILVVDVLQVYLEKLVLAVNEQAVTVLVFAVTPFVTGDLVTSFRAAIQLRDILIQWERMQEELEKLGERRKELEAAISERRQELGTAIEERKQEFGTAIEERKQEFGTVIDERRQELGASIEERRLEFEASLRELAGKLSALQERANRVTMENEVMRMLHGKSIRGLLKRNPRAVSYRHKAAFADLKRFAAKRTNGASPENDSKRDENAE